jgi:tripartite-type tricarboxylate transporter receptor subunit TctC
MARQPEERSMMRSIAVLLFAGFAASAAAQDNYPTRQITLIAPFAAGGSTDLVARVVSEGLRAKLGQTVIVENKPGGTGVVGARDVVKADPDGYTLLLANAGATVIPAAMSNNYPIDLNKDLLPVALTAEFVGVVLAKKDLPVNSMQEFIAYAKANPGKLNFGSSGVGSMVHLSAELLMKETGITMQHLPYKGGSNSMADLLAGTIDALFVSSPVAVGQAENKNLKILAVTSRYRLQALPNVPTIEESGVPGFDTTAWLGVMGPAGLPPAIRQKLSTALVEIAKDPETQSKLRRIGFEPIGKDAAAFQEFFRADIKKWTDFVNERGLKGAH